MQGLGSKCGAPNAPATELRELYPTDAHETLAINRNAYANLYAKKAKHYAWLHGENTIAKARKLRDTCLLETKLVCFDP